MEIDKKTMGAFFGALALIVIMLITTIVNISKISNAFKEIKDNEAQEVNETSNVVVKNEVTQYNLILKQSNEVNSSEDDE